MTREDKLDHKGDIEMAGTRRYQVENGNTPDFYLRIIKEGAFLVVSRPTESNFHFHQFIPCQKTAAPEPKGHPAGRASRRKLPASTAFELSQFDNSA
ncbi:MAG: hypothetical protein VX700_11670 [Pseudomonadota bacterium]|nr:hypothetical protein [Pseudomonadota bacterium]